MSEVSLAHRFFEQWVRACHDQQSELLESWKENKRYTSCILEGPTSIIARIAEQLDLKSYSGGKGYYYIDAILFTEEDQIPGTGCETWVRRIRVAFEHENNFNSGLFKEVSHLLIIDCDLRVLVTYPTSDTALIAQLDGLRSMVNGSDRAQVISESGSLLIIAGSRRSGVDWHGYVFARDKWIDLEAVEIR